MICSDSGKQHSRSYPLYILWLVLVVTCTCSIATNCETKNAFRINDLSKKKSIDPYFNSLPKNGNVRSNERRENTKNMSFGFNTLVRAHTQTYVKTKGVTNDTNAFPTERRRKRDTSDVRCPDNAVPHNGVCIPVTFILMSVMTPDNLQPGDCNLRYLTNRMIYYVFNKNPSWIVDTFKVKRNGTIELVIKSEVGGIVNPYLNRTMSRLKKDAHLMSSTYFLIFQICPNADNRLCVTDIFVSNVENSKQERNVTRVKSCPHCDDDETINLILEQAFFDEFENKSFLIQSDNRSISSQISPQGEGYHHPITSRGSFTNVTSPSFNNSITQFSEDHDKGESLNQNLTLNDVTSEELEYSRCCFCRIVERTIYKNRRCKEKDISKALLFKGGQLLKFLMQEKTFQNSLARFNSVLWYIECMVHTSIVEVRLPDVCDKSCDREVEYFRKHNHSRISALNWRSGKTTPNLFWTSTTSPLDHSSASSSTDEQTSWMFDFKQSSTTPNNFPWSEEGGNDLPATSSNTQCTSDWDDLLFSLMFGILFTTGDRMIFVQ